MFEIGRICLKTAGREAGRYCVIVDKIDDNYVLITGPKVATGVRRRKCNINHLEPIPKKIEIKKNASDEELLNIYEKMKLYEELKIEKPSLEQIKAEKTKEKVKEKVEKKGSKEKVEKSKEVKKEKKEGKSKKGEKKK